MSKFLKITGIILFIILLTGIILPKIFIKDESPSSFTPESSPVNDEEQAFEVERIVDAEVKSGDEIQSAYIKNVYQKGGDVYIDADYFVTLRGKEAVIKCFTMETGGCLWSPELKAKRSELIGKINSFSNDPSTFEDQYYKLAAEYEINEFNNGVWLDVNDNPKIRTFKLSPDVKIRLMKENGSYPDFNALSPQELMNKKNEWGYISYSDDENKENPYFVPFQLILKNGEIIFIYQTYRP